MPDLDLTLSPETVQEYAAAADRNLTCPASVEENRTFKPGKTAGTGTWTEVVKIHDTNITATKSDPNNSNKMNFVIVHSVLGPEAGGFTTNAGRPHSQYNFIDKASLASGDTKVSGPFKRRLSTINSLFKAVGMDLDAGVPSYKAMLAPDSGDKPLVGQVVACVFRKYLNAKTGEFGVDIDGYMPLGS